VELTIPELSLVVLIGASGSGKSTFAARHFKQTEVLSSDAMRGLVSDDENDQSATGDAFELLRFIAAKRLAASRLVVVDATNVQQPGRKNLLELARKYHVMPVAIVLDLPEQDCLRRNEARPDRNFGAHVVRRHVADLKRSLRGLEREGFRYVYLLKSQQEVDDAKVVRTRMWTDRRDERGPLDIIGDVHGCFDELVELLRRLGYEVDEDLLSARHPEGRRVVLLGDLVDRGPKTPHVLRLAMNLVRDGSGMVVPGNHENKLVRKLRGRDVRLTHGIAETLEQLDREPPEFREEVLAFLDGLVSHFVLDGGRLVVAHAGMPAEMQGRASNAVRQFALYGETTGETDEYGLPVRYNWAREYRGNAMVVYGHTPVPEAEWENNTICLDTGCVFGGNLTALRYPERELVPVPAARVYYQPEKPFQANEQASPFERPEGTEVLRLDDVAGKRTVRTDLAGAVVIQAEQASAALEVMSRFAVDPRWLVYLPPTMSPSETSQEAGLLEHPAQAFAYYREHGAGKVICQKKHMGSRAIVVACRDEAAAERSFRISGSTGVCYTRTGRPFFSDPAWQRALLARVRTAADASSLWEKLSSDWFVLDCELMPWSQKAEQLVRQQYATVGAAAQAMLGESNALLAAAGARGVDVIALQTRTEGRLAAANGYVDAYQRYVWEVTSLDDLRLAPFHLLASEGAVHTTKDHGWHLEMLGELCAGDGLIEPTKALVVDATDPLSTTEAERWWRDLVDAGAEGMVVKPFDFTARGRRGLLQPALKVRGPDYLRIIYGPEYDLPQNLERLRSRGLATKRVLASREFALGVEALNRFVRGEPLYRVHECVFAVLALESEPVDPRL
jgi:protein phosphatase